MVELPGEGRKSLARTALGMEEARSERVAFGDDPPAGERNLAADTVTSLFPSRRVEG